MIGLPPLANLALVLAALALGVGLGRRLRRRQVDLASALRRAPWLVATLPALILLLAAHFVLQSRPDLWWRLPPWLEVRYLAVIWGSVLAIFGLLFGCAGALAFAERHPERWKLVLAAALSFTAVEWAHLRHSRSVLPQLGVSERPDGVVLQTTGVTCAAASLANWERLEGRAATERSMASLLGTTVLGTTSGQVVLGLERLGRRCAKVSRPSVRPPAMLFVDHAQAGAESHAVLYVREVEGRHEIWDPLVGKRHLDGAELAAIWHGRAVVCP